MIVKKQSLRLSLTGLLVAVGIVLNVVEAGFPPLIPLPGIKLGLANISTLIAIFLIGPSCAIEVALARSLIAGLIRGSAVGLLLGLAGSTASALMMIIAFVFFKKYMSIMGISVIGACAFNAAQLASAYILVGNANLLYYLPYLLISGAVTGLLIGWGSIKILESLLDSDIGWLGTE